MIHLARIRRDAEIGRQQVIDGGECCRLHFSPWHGDLAAGQEMDGAGLAARATEISASRKRGARIDDLHGRKLGQAFPGGFQSRGIGLPRRHAGGIQCFGDQGIALAAQGRQLLSAARGRWINAIRQVLAGPAPGTFDAIETGDGCPRGNVLSGGVESLQFGEGEDVIVLPRGQLGGGHAQVAAAFATRRIGLRGGAGIGDILEISRGDHHAIAGESRVVAGLDAEPHRKPEACSDAVEVIPHPRQHHAIQGDGLPEINLHPLGRFL